MYFTKTPSRKIWFVVSTLFLLAIVLAFKYFSVLSHEQENTQTTQTLQTKEHKVHQARQGNLKTSSNLTSVDSPTVEANEPNVNGETQSEQQTHYLRVRARAKSHSTTVNKQSFQIPDNWQVQATEIIQQQGRVRSYQKGTQIFVEAHALPTNDGQRGKDAFAVVKITLAPQ